MPTFGRNESQNDRCWPKAGGSETFVGRVRAKALPHLAEPSPSWVEARPNLVEPRPSLVEMGPKLLDASPKLVDSRPHVVAAVLATLNGPQRSGPDAFTSSPMVCVVRRET